MLICALGTAVPTQFTPRLVHADPWVQQPDGSYALMDIHFPVIQQSSSTGQQRGMVMVDVGGVLSPVEDWLSARGSSSNEAWHHASNDTAPGPRTGERLLSALLRQVGTRLSLKAHDRSWEDWDVAHVPGAWGTHRDRRVYCHL